MVIDANQICMGCMEDRGAFDVCPRCGWREGTRPDSPLYLPTRTVIDGQYIIGRVLGYGGFGITYLAWDLNLARKLAIKEYMPNGVASRASGNLNVTIYRGQSDNEFEYGMQQFLEEGRTVARFQDHPGIVKVIDFVRAHGTVYLVMEFLDGCTLETYLKRHNGKLPFAAALNVLAPVMDALRSVHKESFLHRDISPDNVFVLNNGGVKLIDFGAARFALSQRSRNLSVILKEGYAPPEQYSSKGNQGPWTDVYATAATLYRAVTGKIPPPSLDRREGDEIETPAHLGIALTPEQEAALMKGLAVRAADRYPSMELFQAAITGLPEAYFLGGAEQEFQSMFAKPGGGSGTPSQDTKPLDGRTRPLDEGSTRPLDRDAALDGQQHRQQPPPLPPPSPAWQNKLVLTLASMILLLGAAIVYKHLKKPSGGGGGNDTPVPASCAYTLSSPLSTVAAQGGSLKVSVTAGGDCPWNASTEAPWVSIANASGKGNGEISYTVAANNGKDPRAGVILIGGQPHTISQAAKVDQACTTSLSPASVTAQANGGTGAIDVTSGCGWAAITDASWVRITGGASGSGNGRVIYSVGSYTGQLPRTAVIMIGGQIHKISQAPVAVTPQPPGECKFTFARPSANVGQGAGDGRITLNTTDACSWSARTDAGWLTITSSPVGTGSGVLTYQVSANETANRRSASITIGGGTFTIHQDPAPQVTHDSVIRQANTAYRQRNYPLARQLAQQSIDTDPTRPDGYDLLGHMDLYVNGNVGSAEKNMRAALARGGKATFLVRHDHSKLTFEQSCTGYLFVWSNRVAFQGSDPFEVTKAEIKEAKPNRGWLPIPGSRGNIRLQGNVFHIETNYRKYNLAGTSRIQKEEMNMIVELIGKD